MFVLRQIHDVAITDPAKLALVFNGAPVTYGGFWRIIDGVRRALEPHLPQPVESGAIALILIDNMLEAWVVNLALRSLGLHTACLRNAAQIDLFAGMPVICMVTLASERGGPVAAPEGVLSFSLSDPSKLLLTDSGDPMPPLPDLPTPGGHISLTSGTTGRYKKVLVQHGSVGDTTAQRAERYSELGEGYIPEDANTVLNVFNMGLWSAGGYSRPLFVWSLRGAVVIQQTEDLERSFDWEGITHTMATPWYLSRLMALPEGAFPYRPNMQLIVVAGAVTPALARETLRRLTPRILINLSSTEAGGWARTILRSEEDLRWYRLDPRRRVEVVDDAGDPVPHGELGRVRVARRPDSPDQYLNDPDSTAAFFSSDGWFYPGDLGVLDGAGRLALYGRTSDIVHIDGVKYPAEPWERAIQEALECEAVCVLSGNWSAGEEQLHVFIETRRPIPAHQIAAALRATLSGFAETQAHVVDSLPRTGTGKVRRIALAQQLHEGALQPQSEQRY